MPVKNCSLEAPLPAWNIRESPAIPLMIFAGTSISVIAEKIEWLGNEGLYSDVTVAEVPGGLFRVRCHQLNLASGQTGVAALFRGSVAGSR